MTFEAAPEPAEKHTTGKEHRIAVLLHKEEPQHELELQSSLAVDLYCRDHACDVEKIMNDTSFTNMIGMHWIESGYSPFFRKFIEHPRYKLPPFNGNFHNITLDVVEKYKNHPELLDAELDELKKAA